MTISIYKGDLPVCWWDLFVWSLVYQVWVIYLFVGEIPVYLLSTRYEWSTCLLVRSLYMISCLPGMSDLPVCWWDPCVWSLVYQVWVIYLFVGEIPVYDLLSARYERSTCLLVRFLCMISCLPGMSDLPICRWDSGIWSLVYQVWVIYLFVGEIPLYDLLSTRYE